MAPRSYLLLEAQIMKLYDLLWWFGNLELKDLAPWREDYHDIPGQLSELLREERISIHRSDYGKVFISCPAFKKKNPVEEYIKKNPGCTASEIQEALGLNKKAFYDLADEVKINRVREGRSVLHFIEEQETVEPATPVPLPPEQREDRSEPLEEPEDPLIERAWELKEYYSEWEGFEFTVDEIYQDLKEGTGAVEEWVFERLSDQAQQVIEEFEEYSREDLMKRFNLTKKEAINLGNELTSSLLVEEIDGREERTWRVK